MFYHSEKLQSTKTQWLDFAKPSTFYHSEKLQSTKTERSLLLCHYRFIIAKNYRVLKP